MLCFIISYRRECDRWWLSVVAFSKISKQIGEARCPGASLIPGLNVFAVQLTGGGHGVASCAKGRHKVLRAAFNGRVRPPLPVRAILSDSQMFSR